MTEEKMSERFGLSRQTVRRATQTLVEKAVLTRVQGSGTYVGERTPKARAERYMNVAVVSTFYESYIFPRTLRGIEKTLSQAGYAMQVAFTDNQVPNETKILQSLLQKDNIDGLIVEPSCGALPNSNVGYYKEFQERHIPVIFFNDAYPGVEAPCVRLDDVAIAADATQLLIDAGHTKIAGIFKLDDGQGPRRYNGFINAMKRADLPLDARQVFWIDTELQRDLEEQEAYLFKRIAGCTGVVCYNDQVAMQVIELALNRGIRVPEELSVVGIDDSELSELGRVKCTSFPHPLEKLGEKAAENLLHMIEDPFYDGNYIFSAKPVIRDSIYKLA
jgi:GntR family transcriptional regulator of arabinose operon